MLLGQVASEEFDYGILERPFLGLLGVMEKKAETTVVYWASFGIMEKKKETTVV